MNNEDLDVNEVFKELSGMWEDEIKSSRKKRSNPKSDTFDSASISPVANGYVIMGGNEKVPYVFNDIEDAFEFLRAKLKPTTNNEKFLKSV